MKNPTLKGFEGTPEDFTKILFEGWWNHRRKLVRKLESEMECNIFETLQPIGIREKLLEPPLDITHHTRRKDLLYFGKLELKGFRGKEGQEYIVVCGDNHWNRAFKIPDRKFIGMCSHAVHCLSDDPKGLTLPKQNLLGAITGRTRKNIFNRAYGIPTKKQIYGYKIERAKLIYRLYWTIESSIECVDIFEFKSRKELNKTLGW